MNKKKTDRWHALAPEASAALAERDYGVRSLGQRIAEIGIEAGQLAAANRIEPEIVHAWIPGVEIFAAHDLSATASRIVRGAGATR